jgi:DNA-3-methyladenine glycosylase II
MEELPDEDVVAELVAVKGIGEWTAHMFLIFHLERPDVLPVGDLGVRSAIRRSYGLDELPGPAEMERIATSWRPWRSVACRYLWRSLDNEPA